MLTKPQFFYDYTTKQALGLQNPLYLKEAQQLEPTLYDGHVIKKTSAIMIPDSEETLILAEESHPSPSCRPTKVEVPNELPKVSMVMYEHAVMNLTFLELAAGTSGGGGGGSVDVVSVVAVKLEGTSTDAMRALKKFMLCRVSTEI
ncbi:hypothetical protein Tco_0947386 [Tanacetum coccineum]